MRADKYGIMRLLEFQAKDLLRKIGITTPRAKLLRCSEEFTWEGSCVVKAQVPLSDRLRQGGVRFAHSEAEAAAAIQEVLGSHIGGRRVDAVLIEEMVADEASYYLGVTATSTASRKPMVIVGTCGGQGVEEAPRESLWTLEFSASEEFPTFRAWELVSEIGMRHAHRRALVGVITRLVNGFLDYDATLLEINPLVVTRDGNAAALDCHAEIDDDALWRQPFFQQLDPSLERSPRQQTELERLADQVSRSEHRGVAGNVIEFDGDLSLIMGGGGASLVIFDAARLYGGSPANYCEVGGNPSVRKLAELTRLIVSSPRSRGLAVIMNVLNNTRVDLLARGIIKGVLKAGKDPAETILVFRAPGAWEEEGNRILRKYGIALLDRSTSLNRAVQLAINRLNEIKAQ